MLSPGVSRAVSAGVYELRARFGADGKALMASETRPLTDDERRLLARLASPWRQRGEDALSMFWVFMFTFFGGFALVRLVVGPCDGPDPAWIATAAAALALGTGLCMHRKNGPLIAAECDLYARDVEQGVAVRTTYSVTDAIRVEEFEDEGSAYYLKLGDGRVLFLQGQYLYEYDADEDDNGRPVAARFPCARFTIERTAVSGLVLGLSDLGAPLARCGTRAPFTEEDHLANVVPPDGAVLTINFETLRGTDDAVSRRQPH